jgi:hypothetical protein
LAHKDFHGAGNSTSWSRALRPRDEVHYGGSTGSQFAVGAQHGTELLRSGWH